MNLTVLSLVTGAELVLGFTLGRVLIPFFRKLKTGRYDPYIGDRFRQDGSEPRMGGALIFICMVIGTLIGTAFFSSHGELSGRADLRLILTAVSACGIMCALGLHEDMLRDKGVFASMKPFYKHACRFAVILAALYAFRFFGITRTEVLLPFRWGYIDFGYLYQPLMALFADLFLSAVTVCDCPSGKTELGIDGLCPTLMMIFFMSVTAGLTVIGLHPEAELISCAAMGAAGGFLFWGLHPSKLYFGESGALTLGAAAVLSCVLAKAELLLFIGGGAVIADAVCAFLQYAVFRTKKKLLFKGYTLHEHFKNKGRGEFQIIGAAAIVQILFSAAAIMFIVYSAKFL